MHKGSLNLNGGDMGWKQTLILGGAVLLLAACDTATAPIVNVRDGGPTAYLTAEDPTSPSIGMTLAEPEAQTLCPGSGISIDSGEIVVDPSCSESIQLDW
jgi:hypothetical protein